MKALCMTTVAGVLGFAGAVAAHPLGNFTINHFARLEVHAERIAVHYVVDMAEIPSFQELQMADTDGDGSASAVELNALLGRLAPEYAEGLVVTVDGVRLALRPVAQKISTPPAGGLATLRVECDFAGTIPASLAASTRRLRFEDTNHRDRIGWHELVVTSSAGVTVFDSSAFGSAVTDELRAYPPDLLAAPLDERAGQLSFRVGAAPEGAVALRMRDGRSVTPSRDRLAELIALPELTPGIALFALLLAAVLGGLHALSPGHGKTVVGAYLVGARGTARHAAFLGLTVTITHTLGVFGLGLVTLYASQYVVPERLFPILSFVSGAIVLLMGGRLFAKRLRSALTHDHPDQDHTHEHRHHDTHGHAHHHHGHIHSPLGTDGSAITWRSLFALGVSGGVLPCPSALVVLLSAIALHRVGFGLLLIVAFSVGLASVLTAVGVAFVYAGRFLKRPAPAGRLVRVLPVVSALVITCAGGAICYEALAQAGLSVAALLPSSPASTGVLSTASVLGLGLVFGLKHAFDADHLAAVATIVSARKSALSSALVGALWGVGHTIALLAAGVAVILLHVEISEHVALALELGVAIMLIVLGANVLRKLWHGGEIHWHMHPHGEHVHLHPHVDDGSPETSTLTHHGLRLGARPLIVGIVHGLAGSAALMLLVLSTIPSPFLGFAYIGVFGLGSIGGMLFMSALVGLPVHLTQDRFTRVHATVRMLVGFFSVGLGLFMTYQVNLAWLPT